MEISRAKRFLVAAIITLVVLRVGYSGYWWVRGFLEPDIVKHGLERYRPLSSEELIQKLHSISPYDVYIAFRVLGERKEKKAVPTIIGFLKSPLTPEEKVGQSIKTLAKINDPRAVEPLMDILNRGEARPFYSQALEVLTKMRCERAYPYVIRWARREDDYRNGSIAMLKEFGKPEGLAVLKEMREKLRDKKDDQWNVNFAKKEIDEAMKHIESLQGAPQP